MGGAKPASFDTVEETIRSNHYDTTMVRTIRDAESGSSSIPGLSSHQISFVAFGRDI
jgi:hypothetical protein